MAALILNLASAPRSFAAFPATSKSVVNESTVATTNHKTLSERKLPRLLDHVVTTLMPDHVKKEGSSAKAGWQGIVSLICGVVGLFIVPLLFSTAAIVFGILGLNSDKHIYTGLAIAGLILGGIGVIYAIAVLAK